MDFGVQVNVYRVTWQDIVASVQTMEEGQWNSIWFADHHIPSEAVEMKLKNRKMLLKD